ncbi:MAG: DUF3617 family protein [Rhodocyclaceae bacterium]
MMTTFRRIALAALAALPLVVAAQDIPTRKSGLWEITTRLDRLQTPIGPLQQCIDGSTDEVWKQQALDRGDCSKPAFTHTGDTYSFKVVCKSRETTATSEGVITGDMDNAYHGEILTRFDPPVRGQSEAKVTIDAKWIGACKPGMKPGEMLMPKGITINPAELRGLRQPN